MSVVPRKKYCNSILSNVVRAMGNGQWSVWTDLAEEVLGEVANLGSNKGGIGGKGPLLERKPSSGAGRRRFVNLEEGVGLERLGKVLATLEQYRMQSDGTIRVYALLLRSCGNAKALSQGKRVHAHIVNGEQDGDRFLGNFLVEMYGKCGALEDAHAVFDRIPQRNVFSWSIMIAAYGRGGQGKEALKLFRQMQLEGVEPDSITFVSILDACSGLTTLTEGKVIHGSIVASALESDVALGNSLVNMYGKCGSLEDARRVFDQMSQRNVVSWTVMIATYGQNGRGREALDLFRQMGEEGVKPNSITFVIILDACANLAALAEGKQLHSQIAASGLDSNVVLGTALVNMYGKCGSLEDSRSVFDKMKHPNVFSWTAMIAAYGQNGHAGTALKLFRQMQQKGVKPDCITFLCILSACSHAGLVDEGRQYFISMSRDYNIAPRLEHYGCMVDILGRAGLLDEAENLINKMPFQAGVLEWSTFLGACRTHGDVERATLAACHIFKLDPKNAVPYVLLSNIYAASGRWDDVARVRKAMEDRGIKKQPGCSWIEVQGRVHEFFVGDKLHPQAEDIYAELQRLSSQMKVAGYMPDMNSILFDVEDDEKEDMLCYHSEKLAIAFGLIATPCGMPLRITKNLRVCPDCHSAIKFISKIVHRKIVLRDASRFHHFKHGLCSCGDYW